MSDSRISAIKDSIRRRGINVFDCLEHYELSDVWDGTRREQQIKCPGFHGDDRRKSARIYENGTMFCWACDASYDVFAFEMKMSGQPFSSVVYDLAQRYEIHYDYESGEDDEDDNSRSLSEIKNIFKEFETKKPKRKFEDYLTQVSSKIQSRKDTIAVDDYLKYWYAIDQINWRVSTNQIDPASAIIHLESIYRAAIRNNV